MPKRPSNKPLPTLIDNQAQFDEMCALCRTEGRFAFDTEFVMEDCFATDVCLIQIATQGAVFIVDPFLDLDIEGVWRLVADEEVETIVHAGQEDLALCVQHIGKPPKRVYDVQIAAALAGLDYPLSLQRLVQAVLHIRLHKSKTLTDWRIRPLTEARVSYGAEDVCHLLAIQDFLNRRLAETGREAWAREEFERFEDAALYRPEPEAKMRKVKGAGSLSGKNLAVLRDLLKWREALGQRVNRPVRTVLKDHLLVEIARQLIQSADDIRDLRGVNLALRDIQTLAKCVQHSCQLPPDEWPAEAPREVEAPHEPALVSLATAVVHSYCREHDLAYALVASQKTIRALVRHCTLPSPPDRDSVPLLRGWRGRSIGSFLEGVFAGRRTVRVERSDGEWVVHVTPETAGPLDATGHRGGTSE